MGINAAGRYGKYKELSGVKIPSVIFGTSGLGNLFMDLAEEEKLKIVQECVSHSSDAVVFDTAGKYGAGLALETLGNCLRELNIQPEQVIISNKLGWVRTALTTPEPTFEPGVWKNIRHDAIQKISYDGILECFEQGNTLLNGYIPQLVSVHDPDEYLATAENEFHAQQLYNDILGAYDALHELKRQGNVKAIGVGAKDWRIIQRIAADVPLDWVMIANSLTIKNHPKALLDFVKELVLKGVFVINSAVFHSGFLVGGNYYDYKLIQPDTPINKALFKWRDAFFQICKEFSIKPAEACVQYALNVPGIASIALNTTNASRVKENTDMAHVDIPMQFWEALQAEGLISAGPVTKIETNF